VARHPTGSRFGDDAKWSDAWWMHVVIAAALGVAAAQRADLVPYLRSL
jgi:hypothetical protein